MDLMGDVINWMRNASAEQRNWAIETLWGVRSLTGLGAVVKEGTTNIHEYAEAIRTSRDAVNQLVRTQMEGFINQLGTTSMRLHDLARTFGGVLAPEILYANKLFGALVEWMIRFASEHVVFMKAIMFGAAAFVGFAAAITAASIALITFYSSVFALALSLAAPLAIILAIPVALYTLRVAWVKDWGGMRDIVNSFGRSFIDGLNQMFTIFRTESIYLVDGWNMTWADMRNIVHEATNNIMQLFAAGMRRLQGYATRFFIWFQVQWELLPDLVQINLRKLNGYYKDNEEQRIADTMNYMLKKWKLEESVAESIKDMWGETYRDIVDIYGTDYIDKMIENLGELPDAFRSVWKDMVDVAKQDIALIIEAFKEKFPELVAVFDEIEAEIESMLDLLREGEKSFLSWFERGISGLRAFVQEAEKNFDALNESFTGLSSDMGSAFETLFTDILYRNLKKAKDYFEAFGRAVIQTMMKIAAEATTLALFRGALNVFTVFAGAAGGGGAGAGAGAGAGGGLGTTDWSVPTTTGPVAKMGNVLPGPDKEGSEITLITVLDSKVIARQMAEKVGQNVIIQTITEEIYRGGALTRVIKAGART